MSMLRFLVALAFTWLAVPALAAPVLIAATPLAGAPAGASAYTIRYRSTGANGGRIETTGVVIVPAGPVPSGGRDVVAWAHGTSGPHPYLVGTSAARSVVDAVRAARELQAAQASARFVVWGESQGGHAALWTGQMAGRYAPGLQLMGVAAAAPPTDLKANLTGNTNAGVRALLSAFTAESWHETYGIPLSTITRPLGSNLIGRLAANCVTLTIAKRTADATLDWIADRFDGKPAPSDCASL